MKRHTVGARVWVSRLSSQHRDAGNVARAFTMWGGPRYLVTLTDGRTLNVPAEQVQGRRAAN